MAGGASAEERPTCVATQSRIMLKQTPELLNTRGNALHFWDLDLPLLSDAPTFQGGGLEGIRQHFTDSGAGVLPALSVLEKLAGCLSQRILCITKTWTSVGARDWRAMMFATRMIRLSTIATNSRARLKSFIDGA